MQWGQKTIHLLRKLNSFSVILLSFYQSVIESLQSFSFIHRFHSLTVKDRNSLNSAVKEICSKITRVKPRDLNSSYDQQIAPESTKYFGFFWTFSHVPLVGLIKLFALYCKTGELGLFRGSSCSPALPIIAFKNTFSVHKALDGLAPLFFCTYLKATSLPDLSGSLCTRLMTLDFLCN